MKRTVICVILLLLGTGLASAIDLPDDTYVIDQEGTFRDLTYDGYREKGEFSNFEYTGYDNKNVRISGDVDASAVWDGGINPMGKYKLYLWKSVMNNGTKNAIASYTTNTETAYTCVDFSRGNSGWICLGVADLPDLVFNVGIKNGTDGGMIAACGYKYIPASDTEYDFDRIFTADYDTMVFMVDKQKMFYAHNEYKIPDTPPQIINDTTMIPIRFVTENMGADVVWNENDMSVSITKDEKTLVFYIDKNVYFVNGEEKSLLQPPIVINDRTVVPLRVINEEFDRDVVWDDTGVIVIGKNVDFEGVDKDKFYNAAAEIFDR